MMVVYDNISTLYATEGVVNAARTVGVVNATRTGLTKWFGEIRC